MPSCLRHLRSLASERNSGIACLQVFPQIAGFPSVLPWMKKEIILQDRSPTRAAFFWGGGQVQKEIVTRGFPCIFTNSLDLTEQRLKSDFRTSIRNGSETKAKRSTLCRRIRFNLLEDVLLILGWGSFSFLIIQFLL